MPIWLLSSADRLLKSRWIEWTVSVYQINCWSSLSNRDDDDHHHHRHRSIDRSALLGPIPSSSILSLSLSCPPPHRSICLIVDTSHTQCNAVVIAHAARIEWDHNTVIFIGSQLVVSYLSFIVSIVFFNSHHTKSESDHFRVNWTFQFDQQRWNESSKGKVFTAKMMNVINWCW